ncbi:MAG TPA: DNA-binding transcriptional regulator Fis [Thiotrichaceae bacterium]|jgi:Fis family transcriptional regulator|nr:DNA-binding transcriptional regulator Fis [Thiotrichaceae bacterium]HIM08558.1 DNA-binding transcriptional regulator Fis [Gammaproteobacteria bacterium]
MISTNQLVEEIAEKVDVEERSLAENVQKSMEAYFEDLDGHQASDLHALFLEEVEKPFFDVVMNYTKGNITHAAKMLGLNRVTVRNRLKKYGLG